MTKTVIKNLLSGPATLMYPQKKADLHADHQGKRGG